MIIAGRDLPNKMSESGIIENIYFPARSTSALSSPAQEKDRKEAMLIERVCAGDESAFEEFYRKLSPLVHGIVLARVPPGEVDDIVQEVFIAVFRNLHTLRDKASVNPWVAKIARNRAIEYYRRAKPTEQLSENLCRDDNGAQTEASEILAAIRSLPEAYSETLILRLVEGLTGAEIADQTGLKPDSVRVNLHRGMKLLRRKLGVREK